MTGQAPGGPLIAPSRARPAHRLVGLRVEVGDVDARRPPTRQVASRSTGGRDRACWRTMRRVAHCCSRCRSAVSIASAWASVQASPNACCRPGTDVDAVVVAAPHERAGLGLHAVEQVDGGQHEGRDGTELRLAGDQRRAGRRRPHPPRRLEHHAVSVLVHRVVVMNDHQVARLPGRRSSASSGWLTRREAAMRIDRRGRLRATRSTAACGTARRGRGRRTRRARRAREGERARRAPRRCRGRRSHRGSRRSAPRGADARPASPRDGRARPRGRAGSAARPRPCGSGRGRRARARTGARRSRSHRG